MVTQETRPLKRLALILGLGASIVVLSTSTTFAEQVPVQVKYDRKIAEAAQKRAAEKVGNLRGSLQSDDMGALADEGTFDQSSSQGTEVLEGPLSIRRRSWQPLSGAKRLPPMVSAFRIDTIVTGGTKPTETPLQRPSHEEALTLNPYPFD